MNEFASRWLFRVTSGISALFVCILGYLVLFEPPWLTYTNSPFPVLNSPVRPGTAVQMMVGRCSSANVTRVYALSRALVCGKASLLLPAGLVSIEPGCTSVVSAVNIVPLGAPPGRCYLHGFGEIQGVVHTNSVEWKSQPFDVVP